MPLRMHRWFSICNHRAYRAKTGTQKTFKPRWKGDISTKHKVFNLHVSYSASLHMHACSVVSDSLPPMDWSPPGSSVHEISQASILEWGAISSSRRSSWPRYQIHVSYVSFIAGRFFKPPRTDINDTILYHWYQSKKDAYFTASFPQIQHKQMKIYQSYTEVPGGSSAHLLPLSPCWVTSGMPHKNPPPSLHPWLGHRAQESISSVLTWATLHQRRFPHHGGQMGCILKLPPR